MALPIAVCVHAGTRADYYDIDEKEFLKTLRQRLGYTGPVDALRGCFALLGGEDDGKISLTEFFEWATGRKNAMLASEVSTSRLMSMRLVNPPLGPDDDEDDEWSIDMLRSALQQMLIKARVPPHVLQSTPSVCSNQRPTHMLTEKAPR